MGNGVVKAEIIAGMFLISSVFGCNTSQANNDLKNDISELKNQLNETTSSYTDLQEQYDLLAEQNEDLNRKYQDLLSNTNNSKDTTSPDTNSNPQNTQSTTNASQEIWIDQLDIFYQEGKNINGRKSEGWCKIWDSSFQKDSLGDNHTHGIYIRGFREDTYIIDYILDETFTGLKGLFTLEYESRNTQIENNLKVYALNENSEKTELLYETPQSLQGGVEPIPFDFPINSARHIRIEISSGDGEYGEFFLALVDTCFYK